MSVTDMRRLVRRSPRKEIRLSVLKAIVLKHSTIRNINATILLDDGSHMMSICIHIIILITVTL